MTLLNNEDNIENIHYEMYRDLFQKMQTPECIAAEMELWSNTLFGITLADSVHKYSVKGKLTDTGFFHLYQFHFIEGAPFTQDDFDNGRNNVVRTEGRRTDADPRLPHLPHLWRGGDTQRTDGEMRG